MQNRKWDIIKNFTMRREYRRKTNPLSYFCELSDQDWRCEVNLVKKSVWEITKNWPGKISSHWFRKNTVVHACPNDQSICICRLFRISRILLVTSRIRQKTYLRQNTTFQPLQPLEARNYLILGNHGQMGTEIVRWIHLLSKKTNIWQPLNHNPFPQSIPLVPREHEKELKDKVPASWANSRS